MSALLQRVAKRAAASVRLPQLQKRTILSMENAPKRGEESEYIHARDQLLGIAGSAVFITYAAIVLAGEPAHEEAHPYYNAPYTFVKRGANTGAEWWPGRQCQFFEFNCFAQTYKQADQMLNETESKH